VAEKRGEVAPEDLSDNLIVQLGVATEPLNRAWYERNTGNAIIDVQRRLRHPVLRWMAATLDGRVSGTGAIFEAKFMLPWSFAEGAAAEKHMAQLQHAMWVTNVKTAALSIITGGGKWVEITVHPDTLYQHLLTDGDDQVLAMRPNRGGAEALLGRAAAAADRGVRIVDMGGSNSWAEFAGLFQSTRPAFLDHERAKVGLKELMPADAKEAFGHGVRAKRSKSGAISFNLLAEERGHVALE
jgi:hypothetical protein